LKSSADRVFLSMGSRKRHSARRIASLSPFSSLRIFALAVLFFYLHFHPGARRVNRLPINASRSVATHGNTGETADRRNDPLTCRKLPRLGHCATTAKRSKSAATPAPSGYTEEGNASWYGVPFHGRRASNGETYDMYKLTAAHRTLPFETMVRVTNLINGKSTVANHRSRPFVDNRIIDLSFAARKKWIRSVRRRAGSRGSSWRRRSSAGFSPCRLGRSATARMPSGCATVSTACTRPSLFSNMIHPTGFSIVFALARFRRRRRSPVR